MAFVEPSNGARIVVETSPITCYTGLLNGTVNPGDPIFHNGTGWVQADDSTEHLPPQMIAAEGGVSGGYIGIAYDAIIDFGSGCTATAGSDLFLSDTAGDYSASAGSVGRTIGLMLTAQVAHVWSKHSG